MPVLKPKREFNRLPTPLSSFIGREQEIAEVAKLNNLPVDKITQVSVLDPYFYK